MKKKKPIMARNARKHGGHSRNRQLVPVDQGPLRKKAATECGREMARLEKARSEWRRFEQHDKPAYERWIAASFGPLLTKLRECESLVRQKEMVIQEVEAELIFGGARSPRAAYAAVMRRRSEPPPSAPRDEDWDAPPPGADNDPFERAQFEKIPEFEQHLLFEDFLRMVMGINPDRLSEKKYEAMFADFKNKVLGQGIHEAPPRAEPAHAAANPEQARIKEIYRILVRRLHPDTRADSDAEISALWHEVQDAYSTGNVERLEMLLALTDIRSNEAGEHTSLSQMRAVLRELRRSLNALSRSLRDAKKEHAWNFARVTNRAPLQSKLQRQFASDLARQERTLRGMEAQIASWSTPPGPRRRNAPRPHPEFPF